MRSLNPQRGLEHQWVEYERAHKSRAPQRRPAVMLTAGARMAAYSNARARVGMHIRICRA